MYIILFYFGYGKEVFEVLAIFEKLLHETFSKKKDFIDTPTPWLM